MKRLPIDNLRHVPPPASPLVEATLELIRDVVRRRYDQWDGDWRSFATQGAERLITRADLEQVERSILASGHRFDCRRRFLSASGRTPTRPRAASTRGPTSRSNIRWPS